MRIFNYVLLNHKEHKRLQYIKNHAKQLVSELGSDVPDHRYRRELITALQYNLDRLSKKDTLDID